MTAKPGVAGVTTPEMRCLGCDCTEDKPCEGGCSWVSRDPPICSKCGPPVSHESLGGALIDSARISVMAAMAMLPPDVAPKIILPGADGEDDAPPSIHDCLAQAMQWLNAARIQTIELSDAPVTSLHVVGGR